MKFRFYITNLFSGRIEGTNDQNKADELAACEEHFIIDTDTGEWLQAPGVRIPVKEHE